MTQRFFEIATCVLAMFILASAPLLAQQQCDICECEYESTVACESCDCCPNCLEAYQGCPPATAVSPLRMPQSYGNMPPTRSRQPGIGMNLTDQPNFAQPFTQPRNAAPNFAQPFTQPRTAAAPNFAQPFTQPRNATPNFDQPFTQPRSVLASPQFPQQQSLSGQDSFSNLAAPAPQAGFAGSDSGLSVDSGLDIGAAAAPAFAAASGAGDNGLAASAISGAVGAGLASAADSALAPNIIGDFLNGLTTGAGLRTRIAIDFENQSSQFFTGGTATAQSNTAFSAADAARRARITNGFDGGTTGDLEVLTPIPGVVNVGDGGSFDTNDLTGANMGVQPRVQGTVLSETQSTQTETLSTFERTTTDSELTASLVGTRC